MYTAPVGDPADGRRRVRSRRCVILPRVNETRFGYPLDDWLAAKAQVKAVLGESARARRTITYGELCDAVHAIRLFPRSRALLGMLHDVCTEEDEARGIMLASIVVSKATGMPGKGYFAFAETLGRDTSETETMWRAEVERVFAAYVDGGVA